MNSACGSAAKDLFTSSSLGSSAAGQPAVVPVSGDGGESAGGPEATGGAAGSDVVPSGGASTVAQQGGASHSGATHSGGAASGGATHSGGAASGGATNSAGSASGGAGVAGSGSMMFAGNGGTGSSQCAADGPGATFFPESGHCYLLVQELAVFADAAAHCAGLGAHLVTIGSEAENTFVASLAREDHWLGASDGKNPKETGVGSYAWVTGESFSYEDWTQGQPNATATDCEGVHGGAACYEHCAFQWGGGSEWNDRSCLHSISAVCEWDGP